MSTPEQEAQQEVRLAAPSLHMRLLRNNRGAFKDDRGNFVRFGLGNESTKDKDFLSSDLIGITVVEITPEMVGKKIGVFTAVEVKPKGFKMRNFKKGSREEGQSNFIRWVMDFAGFGGFTTSGDDLRAIAEYFISRLKQ